MNGGFFGVFLLRRRISGGFCVKAPARSEKSMARSEKSMIKAAAVSTL
jgi:hypothetical protein